MTRFLHTKPVKRRPLWRLGSGFTLVEILIVLAIVSVLAFISFGIYSRSRASTYRVSCDVHVKSIALALDAFKQEHGYFPTTLSQLKSGRYITDDSILSCPLDPRPGGTYEDFYILRNARSKDELPVLVCPFHESTEHGIQAFVGRYTTQARVAPAVLDGAVQATVEHPGKSPVAAPVGLELHGADRIRTGSSGSASITFADGSKAEIAHDADLTVLQSFLQSKGELYTLVRQNVGSVQYSVHHGSKFDVVTPTTTAGALGTQFEIRVNATTGTWLNVTDGRVRFNTLGGDPVVVTGGSNWYSADPPPPGPGPGPGGGPGGPRPKRGQGSPPPR